MKKLMFVLIFNMFSINTICSHRTIAGSDNSRRPIIHSRQNNPYARHSLYFVIQALTDENDVLKSQNEVLKSQNAEIQHALLLRTAERDSFRNTANRLETMIAKLEKSERENLRLRKTCEALVSEMGEFLKEFSLLLSKMSTNK